MADGTDARYMARALQLARRGLNTTDPNPRVGCVIVRDGQVVGEGWHHRAGEAHAERHALNAAGAAAAGATVYLTLEPCAHQGRTPCDANQRQSGHEPPSEQLSGHSDPMVIGRPFTPVLSQQPVVTDVSALAVGVDDEPSQAGDVT